MENRVFIFLFLFLLIGNVSALSVDLFEPENKTYFTSIDLPVRIFGDGDICKYSFDEEPNVTVSCNYIGAFTIKGNTDGQHIIYAYTINSTDDSIANQTQYFTVEREFTTQKALMTLGILLVLLGLTFSFFYIASINFTEAAWLNFPLKIGGILLGFVMTYSILRIVRNLAREFVKFGYLEAPLNVLVKFMSIALPIIFLIAAGILVFDILLSLRRETVKFAEREW